MPLAAPGACRPLLAALLLGCGVSLPAQQVPAVPAPPAPPHAPTLLVNGLLNSGFEWIADATTEPPKHGAYWLGAFAPAAGDAACSVVEDRPWRGRRALRLSSAAGEVLQKIVADARFTDSLVLTAAVRTASDGVLLLTLEDGQDRRATVRIRSEGDALLVEDGSGAPVPLLAAQATPREAGNDGWHRVSIDIGALFVREHGGNPVPRLNLRLRCEGPGSALADVDELTAAVRWPALRDADLQRWIADLVRWTLDVWYLPLDRGGLQVVDPATGYATFTTFDVVTGARAAPERTVSLHTIHVLLLRWLEEAHRRGWQDEIARWTPELRRLTASLLANNFDPDTGLPRTVNLPGLQPNDDAAVTIDHYVEFLLDARALVDEPALAAACLAQARRTADTLVALQREHDIPPDRAPKPPSWDARAGRLVGDTSNWFGFLPDRLTPQGAIETDKRFYTSWAILTGRTFWYEFMSSPRAIMRVHELQPAPGDLAAVHRAVTQFHRDWDASRYDLENDTDDHYGHLCVDLLDALQHSRGEYPEALALLQAATDHRLPREATSADDTLWVQAARLGTACAGDSPRAFRGPLGLHELPPEVNPASSGLPLYRDALLELAQNDFKGRQLTNGQFTESFFKNWEMVCICYRGTYQGDCREQPAEFWQGDVGDTFGGPPTSAIDAQAAAFRLASASRRPQILSALELIRHATDSTLQRRYGYLFGLDEAVARQYGLPDKYTIGLSSESAAGLGYVMAWMRLLPYLGGAASSASSASARESSHEPPQLQFADEPGSGGALRILAPAGSVVLLCAQEQPFPAPVSDRDGRMLGVDLAEPPGGKPAVRVKTGPDGACLLPLDQLPIRAGLIQPLLLDPDSGEPLAIGVPLVLPAGAPR